MNTPDYHLHVVGFLAALNLSLGAIAKWVESITPILNALVPVGQFLVAMATVAFICHKIRRANKAPKEKKEDPSLEESF